MMIESLSSAHGSALLSRTPRRTVTSPLVRLMPLALFAAPVFADDAGPAAPAAEPAAGGFGQLQEVVVTAEKRQETVQATPISISALSDVQLERANITSLEELAGSVPGISMRTAGPGQTEYEIRGLTSAGGSTATVGFYLDETPLSANAVALNGRTVIDPDLFDLNHVEVLRGPQGTLYGAGSMGGTIKLVTNQPQLGKWEAATDVNASHTDSGGSWNAGGSAMLNIPMGDMVALRVVGTDKYVSGWLNRYIYGASFPFPTNPAGTPGANPLCLAYYCTRGDIAALTPEKVVDGVNLERFTSARAMLLVKPSDQLSVTTTVMYQRILTDGYNAYQATGTSPDPYPSTPGVYQPYDQPEPYSDQFKLASLDLVYDLGPATLTFAPAYFQRWVIQSQDSTEPLENINNLTQFLQSLYQEGDLTTQDSVELRLASNGNNRLQWQGGIYGADLHSTYNGYNQDSAYATALTCGYPGLTSYPIAGHCMPPVSNINPASNDCVASNIPGMFQDCVFNSPLRYPNASLPPYPNRVAANPNGVIFNDHNPNVMKQWAIFGETSYKLLDDLKLTAGIRYFKFNIDNSAEQAGLGTASGNQDPTILNSSSSGSAVLPKLNLSYTPTPDLTFYGTIAKGSRPGGVNLPIPIPTLQELEANPAAYNCNVPLANQQNPSLPVPPGTYVSKQPTFGPDSVWSYELGEKWRFDDQRFTVNGDVYYIKWTDIQQVVSLTCGYPADINAGNAQAYGPEIETSTRITQELTFNLSYAYTHAVINDPNAAAEASGFYPGIRVINVPKYTAIASLDYLHPITDTLTGVFHITSSLVGPILDQAYYREELASHNLVDLRAGVTGGQWGAYLTCTNLTDKVAELTIDNTVFAWQQPTITRVSTNQPRTIGVDFQYRF
jgi:iron complex outermembrane recepter protein